MLTHSLLSIGQLEEYYTAEAWVDTTEEISCTKVIASYYWYPDEEMTGCFASSWEALSYLRQIQRLDHDLTNPIVNPGLHDIQRADRPKVSARTD